MERPEGAGSSEETITAWLPRPTDAFTSSGRTVGKVSTSCGPRSSVWVRRQLLRGERTAMSLVFLLVLLLAARPLVAQRTTLALDRGWRFHLGDVPGAQEAAFDDSGWRSPAASGGIERPSPCRDRMPASWCSSSSTACTGTVRSGSTGTTWESGRTATARSATN